VSNFAAKNIVITKEQAQAMLDILKLP
jgi:hypothetical protein